MPYPPNHLSVLCNEMDEIITEFKIEADKLKYKPFSNFAYMMRQYVVYCYLMADSGIDFTKCIQGREEDIFVYSDAQLEQLQQCFELVFPGLELVRKPR